MKKGDHVRWYVTTLGDFNNAHSPHWHGNTVMVAGQRTDVLSIISAQMITANISRMRLARGYSIATSAITCLLGWLAAIASQIASDRHQRHRGDATPCILGAPRQQLDPVRDWEGDHSFRRRRTPMMQTQWPGLGSSFDFSALDTSFGGDDGYAGDSRRISASAAARRYHAPMVGLGTGTGNGNGADPLGGLFGAGTVPNGSIAGISPGLVSLLQQLVGSFLNQNQNKPSPNPAAESELHARRARAPLRRPRRQLDGRPASRGGRHARRPGGGSGRRALGQHDLAERPRAQHADRRRLSRLHRRHAARHERRHLEPVGDRARELRPGRGHDEPRRLVRDLRQRRTRCGSAKASRPCSPAARRCRENRTARSSSAHAAPPAAPSRQRCAPPARAST